MIRHELNLNKLKNALQEIEDCINETADYSTMETWKQLKKTLGLYDLLASLHHSSLIEVADSSATYSAYIQRGNFWWEPLFEGTKTFPRAMELAREFSERWPETLVAVRDRRETVAVFRNGRTYQLEHKLNPLTVLTPDSE